MAGYRTNDLSIAGRMLYHLSYGGSTQFFSENLFMPIRLWIHYELFINFFNYGGSTQLFLQKNL